VKKFLVSIFAVFYLGIASGATVHFHYCMGELLSWGLTKANTGNCSNCGMEKSDTENCCKDEVQQIKVEKAQKAESSFQFQKVVSGVLPQASPEPSVALLREVIVTGPFAHAPPRTEKAPAFLLNCNFRI
jgi:hypothetical protein